MRPLSLALNLELRVAPTTIKVTPMTRPAASSPGNPYSLAQPKSLTREATIHAMPSEMADITMWPRSSIFRSSRASRSLSSISMYPGSCGLGHLGHQLAEATLGLGRKVSGRSGRGDSARSTRLLVGRPPRQGTRRERTPPKRGRAAMLADVAPNQPFDHAAVLRFGNQILPALRYES